MSDKEKTKNGSNKKERKQETASSSSSTSMSTNRSRQYLARYTIRPSTAVSYTPRSVRFVRPVTAARMKSRDPKRLATNNVYDGPFPSFSQRIHDEHDELDTHSKKLASLVKSITTSDSKRQGGESIFVTQKRRYSSMLSSHHRISDLDVIFRDDQEEKERRKIFRVPRTNWMRKLEESALKNEETAKKSLLVQDEEVGDMCCCPMFTTHLFFSKNYHTREHFKLKPAKKGRKRTDK